MLLLDSHCWIWLKRESTRLPSPLRRRLLRDPTALVLSSASIMEIGIKYSLGKLTLDGGPARLVTELLEDGVTPLSATIDHALRMASLPLLHRDPFDRLLVAQAQVEGFTLVTADPNILKYDVKTLDARK